MFICVSFPAFASFPSFSGGGKQGCFHTHIPSRIVPARGHRSLPEQPHPAERSSRDTSGTLTAQNSSWDWENSCWNALGLRSGADAEFSSPAPRGKEQELQSQHSGAIIFPNFGTGELFAPCVLPQQCWWWIFLESLGNC